MGFRLTIEQGPGQGQSFDFDGETTIGRSDGNDVVLADSGVSRHHATISFDEDRWVLSDEGTANGTLLNGSRVEHEFLEDGDAISIGSVTFLFEEKAGGGAYTAKSPETRITSMDPEGTRPGISLGTGGTSPGTYAPADPSAGKGAALRRLVAMVVVLGVFGAVAFRLLGDAGTAGGGLASCPPQIPFKEGLREYVFGQGVDADCQAGDALTFTFMHAARSRAILNYAPFFTEKGEVGIYVNDVKVADVPLVQSQRALRQEYTIPDRALVEGQTNTVSFRPEGEGNGVWGVKRVDLEVIALAEADLAKAQESIRLGERRYREKNIAAPNLFLAWHHLQEARRYMEGLEPKPSEYEPTLALIKDVEKELDKLCQERMFAAQIEAKYNRYTRANDNYRFILAAFPDDRHDCRKRAQENMWEDD